jgi:trans-aconitate methyltransferase
MTEAPHLPRGAVPDPPVPPGVDPAKPSPARLYDYYLGGHNNFEADRKAAEALRQSLPALSDAAWANRGFHQRAATWLAAEVGLRQFIDIGSGLPTVGNTHQVIQRIDPAARVVYGDIDPMVAAQSAPLLASVPNVTLITADLRDPDALLSHPTVRSMIDFTEPAGLLMTAVLHFVADDRDPWGLLARYVAALAPGSYLALSHATSDGLPPLAVHAMVETYANATEQLTLRSRAEVERFFAGMEMVAPYRGATDGLTFVGQWGAVDPASADSDGSRVLYCGVAKCR